MAISTPILLELGPEFYDAVRPASFPEAKPRFLNHDKAQYLQMTEMTSDEDWIRFFHHFEAWPGNLKEPLALRYHGHQFRHYNPELGDGRGFVYGQFQGADGRIYDLGTKGSGQTPYSRSGDGRLTLKGAVREALATEQLESLGVFTSKTFSFFETGEQLIRNDEPSPTRSAVLTRMSLSHIRIGTFQRLAYFNETENIVKLLNYCSQHYYPELLQKAPLGSQSLAENFLLQVSHKLAELSAQYMMAGFVHGVLNSDNMNITGESFDYGPYRFLPNYDPTFTAAYFDRSGLYCYGRQPSAIYWNLVQLAEALKTAFPEIIIQEKIESYSQHFTQEVIRIFFHRLNLKPESLETADEILAQFFLFLSKNKAPFEQTFFDLFGGVQEERLSHSPQSKLYQTAEFQELKKALKNCTVEDPERSRHPYFQNSKPCTLLIDEIEEIWSHIDQKDDWSAFYQKVDQIRSFRGIYKLYP